jgi:ABC-type multidrug transport system permease subunit
MRFWQLFKRNLKEIIRDPIAVVLMLVLPLLLALVLRLFYPHNGFLVPMAIVFGGTTLVIASRLITLRDAKSGYLRRLRTTPTRIGQFILGYLFIAAAVALVEVILLLICAWAFGVR